MDQLRITGAALDALSEYSTSLPTGTTIGKRWKQRRPDGWLIGEYVPHQDPGTVGIKWWVPYITLDADAVRRPMDLFVERATNWALGFYEGKTIEEKNEAFEGWAAMLDDWSDEFLLPYRKVLS